MKLYEKKIQRRKKGEKTWETISTVNDEKSVVEMLAECVIARYIGHASYIKSIKRKQNYNGTATYIVTFHEPASDTEVRNVFIVPIYC